MIDGRIMLLSVPGRHDSVINHSVGPLPLSSEITGLQMKDTGRIVWRIDMKTKANGHRTRVELGRHIVADSAICGGQPTFKCMRIMV